MNARHQPAGIPVAGMTIREKSLSHCTIAASVREGDGAITNDGHLVVRASRDEWTVSDAPEGSPYSVGARVRSRVLFWRMNGLCAALTARRRPADGPHLMM